jgi:hypothetical protein
MPLGRTPRRMIAVTTSCATPIAPRRVQIRRGSGVSAMYQGPDAGQRRTCPGLLDLVHESTPPKVGSPHSTTRSPPGSLARKVAGEGIGLLDASSANTFAGFGGGAITPSLPPGAVQDPRPLLGVRGSKNSRRSPRPTESQTHDVPTLAAGDRLWRNRRCAPGCDGVARAFGHDRFWVLAVLKSQPSILAKDPLRPHDTLTTLAP